MVGRVSRASDRSISMLRIEGVWAKVHPCMKEAMADDFLSDIDLTVEGWMLVESLPPSPSSYYGSFGASKKEIYIAQDMDASVATDLARSAAENEVAAFAAATAATAAAAAAAAISSTVSPPSVVDPKVFEVLQSMLILTLERNNSSGNVVNIRQAQLTFLEGVISIFLPSTLGFLSTYQNSNEWMSSKDLLTDVGDECEGLLDLTAAASNLPFAEEKPEAHYSPATTTVTVKCKLGHELALLTSNPSSYFGSANCDLCAKHDILRLGTIHHCSHCNFDVCAPCWTTANTTTAPPVASSKLHQKEREIEVVSSPTPPMVVMGSKAMIRVMNASQSIAFSIFSVAMREVLKVLSSHIDLDAANKSRYASTFVPDPRAVECAIAIIQVLASFSAFEQLLVEFFFRPLCARAGIRCKILVAAALGQSVVEGGAADSIAAIDRSPTAANDLMSACLDVEAAYLDVMSTAFSFTADIVGEPLDTTRLTSYFRERVSLTCWRCGLNAVADLIVPSYVPSSEVASTLPLHRALKTYLNEFRSQPRGATKGAQEQQGNYSCGVELRCVLQRLFSFTFADKQRQLALVWHGALSAWARAAMSDESEEENELKVGGGSSGGGGGGVIEKAGVRDVDVVDKLLRMLRDGRRVHSMELGGFDCSSSTQTLALLYKNVAEFPWAKSVGASSELASPSVTADPSAAAPTTTGTVPSHTGEFRQNMGFCCALDASSMHGAKFKCMHQGNTESCLLFIFPPF